MAGISTTVSVNDQLSAAFRTMTSSITACIGTFIEMQETADQGLSPAQISNLNASLVDLNAAALEFEESINRIGSEPVEVPVTWKTDNLEVFTNSGVERFTQEAYSANVMLANLNGTQMRIQQTAMNTDILPDGAVRDISGMQQRLQAIQARIQQISTNRMNIGVDAANEGLEELRSQLNRALQDQDALNQAMEDMDVSAANAAYLRLSQTISGTERYIRDNVDEQGRFNQSIESGTQQADKLTEMIKKAVTAYVSLQSVGKVLSISDDLSQITSRLNMMNDSMQDNVQSSSELINMIYASAQSARGSFADMADVVARFGNNAGSAFSSTEEVVAFSELIQKQMTIAGASTQEASNAMLQLSQALGSGVLRGDELNSIFEQAPNLIQSIADYLDVPIGQIRDMASEGELSASVVKAAIFASAEEVDKKFNSMNMTWGQVWQSMKNTALISFQPVLNEINTFASSDEIQTVVNGINSAISFMANVALNAFEIMEQGVSFVVDNWSILAPIITGVAVALGAYVVVMTIYNTVQAVSNGLKTLGAIAAVAHGTSTAAEAAATTGMTAAQVSLNAALLACPLTWIVVAVIAIVAALYAGVAAVNKFQGTSISATGIIGAAFAVAGAAILNNFIVPLQNAFASIANFLGNVFNNPVAAVKILIYDMALTVIGYIANMASAIETLINKIPGVTVDITSGLDSFYDSLETAQQQVKDESGWVEYVSKMDYVSYEGAAQTGYDKGSSLASSISDSFGDFAIGELPDSIAAGISDITDTTAETASNTGGIADSLDVTEDSLEWMKDIAEREIIDRTVFRDIKVDMGGVNNTVNNMQDLDSIGQYLANSIEEQMAVSAEGV